MSSFSSSSWNIVTQNESPIYVHYDQGNSRRNRILSNSSIPSYTIQKDTGKSNIRFVVFFLANQLRKRTSRHPSLWTQSSTPPPASSCDVPKGALVGPLLSKANEWLGTLKHASPRAKRSVISLTVCGKDTFIGSTDLSLRVGRSRLAAKCNGRWKYPYEFIAISRWISCYFQMNILISVSLLTIRWTALGFVLFKRWSFKKSMVWYFRCYFEFNREFQINVVV